VRALRPLQWTKNTLLAVPLITGHEVDDPQRLMQLLLAFVAFCAAASATYLVNDLADRSSDQQHPRKKYRPIAAGLVRPPAAVAMAVTLLIVAALICLLLPSGFAIALGSYLAATTAYSWYLKKKAIVDVLMLSGLYALRILAGGIAVGLFPTPWLLAFAVFIFTSLAFAKRYCELRERLEVGEAEGNHRRGYQPVDLPLLASAGLATGYLSVLVFAFYLNSEQVLQLYRHPALLWLACPLLLYWVTRVWLMAQRGTLADDPVVFTLTDRASYACLFLLVVLIYAAT
jgi:4-hydroxybenzoate polyprenyltransferase